MWNWLRTNPLMQQLQTERDWLYLHEIPGGRLQIVPINGQSTRRLPYVLAASHDIITFAPLRKHIAAFTFTPADIRWFGRPSKYSYGMNDMWLHVERKAGWYLVKISMERARMVEWVRVMKQLTPDDLHTAYRRRRPYIHYGPLTVSPAEQDIYGAWTLHPPQSLYLMPLYIVLINGVRVIRLIPLDIIQNIRAGARLDAPDTNGLVQFTADGEKVAFTLPQHEQFAAALAEAAKRSLEAPIMRKSKPKEH